MANVRATKSGNWSDTTVWNTSALPTASDDVYCNNYTVTIDQDVTVKSLRNTSATGITAGGGFAISGAYTVDCSSGTGFVCGSTGATPTLVAVSTSSGTRTALKGTVANTGSTNGAPVVTFTGTGIYDHTGTVGKPGITVTGTGTLNVTGTLDNSTGSNAGSYYCVYCTNSAVINIIGNVTNTSNGNNGVVKVTNSSAVVTITGSVFSGTSVMYATLDCVGVLTIIGTLVSQGGIAVSTTNSSTILSGPFISTTTTGLLPFSSSPSIPLYAKLTGITNNEFRFAKNGGGTTSLWSSDVNSGAPSAANVRSGTKFGVSNEFTGTLAVPPTNSVASGVPVDNTTGTAALSPSDIAAVVGAQIAAALDSTP